MFCFRFCLARLWATCTFCLGIVLPALNSRRWHAPCTSRELGRLAWAERASPKNKEEQEQKCNAKLTIDALWEQAICWIWHFFLLFCLPLLSLGSYCAARMEWQFLFYAIQPYIHLDLCIGWAFAIKRVLRTRKTSAAEICCFEAAEIGAKREGEKMVIFSRFVSTQWSFRTHSVRGEASEFIGIDTPAKSRAPRQRLAT